MQLDKRFVVQPFSDVEYSGILVAILGNGVAIHAVKAFFDEATGWQDLLVSVGPFGDEVSRGPVVYRPNALATRTVLDVSTRYQFVPSIEPTDIGRWDGAGDLVGRVVFTKDHMHLGVVVPGQGESWRTGFLDLQSGRLSFELPEHTVLVSSSWRIVEQEGNSAAETVFEHRVQPESHG